MIITLLDVLEVGDEVELRSGDAAIITEIGRGDTESPYIIEGIVDTDNILDREQRWDKYGLHYANKFENWRDIVRIKRKYTRAVYLLRPGDVVKLRCGIEARIERLELDPDVMYPIAGENISGGDPKIMSWTRDGFFHSHRHESPKDIVGVIEAGDG